MTFECTLANLLALGIWTTMTTILTGEYYLCVTHVVLLMRQTETESEKAWRERQRDGQTEIQYEE